MSLCWSLPGHRMPHTLENALPIFLREQDKLTDRLALVMSRHVIPNRKRAQGRACKLPSSQSSSGMTQEVNKESPRRLDGQRPGRRQVQLNMLFLYSSSLALSGTLKTHTHTHTQIQKKTFIWFNTKIYYEENKDGNNSNMKIIPVNIYLFILKIWPY